MEPIKTVNMHEAKSQLSSLIRDYVQKGTTVVVANAGKPVAKLVAFEPEQRQRVGFMKGAIKLPDADQFNRIGEQEIEAMFKGDE